MIYNTGTRNCCNVLETANDYTVMREFSPVKIDIDPYINFQQGENLLGSWDVRLSANFRIAFSQKW